MPFGKGWCSASLSHRRSRGELGANPGPWPRRQPSPAARGRWLIVGLLPQVSVTLTVAALVGILVMAALPLGYTLVTGILVGAVPAAVRGSFASPAGQLALRSLAILAALFVAQRTVGPIRSALLATLGRELDRYLEERLMLALHAPPGIAHLEDPLVLDQIRIAQGVGGSGYTAGAAAVALGNKLPIWLQSGAYAVVLGHFQAWLALGYFAVQVGIAVINRREYLRTVQVAAQQTQTLRRSDYLRDLALTAGAAKEMRLYALADWLIGRYSSSWRESITAVWRDRHQGDARLRAAAIVGALAQVIMLGALGWAGVRGSISLTALTVFVGSVFGMGGLAALGLDDLALARASMRPAPLLLILDEPTAAIDALTEYALFERFREAARRGELQGAITLVVSHRFSTVRMADLIVVLDDGRIRERGSHDELMRNNGLYAELYRLQARAYR